MNENPFSGIPAPVISNAALIDLNEEKKEYICPLSGFIFAEPVVLSNGRTYERQFAVRLLQDKNPIDPITREPLDKNFIQPNWSMKKLTQIFLSKHPEFNKEVYCPNPILVLVEKSLHSSYSNLEEDLLNLINNHPDFLKKIESDDLEQLLKISYKNAKFATFFAILKYFKISTLQDIAKELMTSTLDQEEMSPPNVFYVFAWQDNLSDTYFDLAVNLIGEENCQKIFAQNHVGWPTVFQMFWMAKYYTIGKSILNFLSDEDQKTQSISKLTIPTGVYDDEDEDNLPHVSTYTYSNLLYYMINKYPEEDISETIELLKRKCPDEIEKMLSEPISSSDSQTLLHYALSLPNLENGILLAKLCTQPTVNKVILSSIKTPLLKIHIHDMHSPQQRGAYVVCSNFVHQRFYSNQSAAAMQLLSLLKDDAAQALLCPWSLKILDSTIPSSNLANVIQHFYLSNQFDICEELIRKGFLTDEQLVTALSAILPDGKPILNSAIYLPSIIPLQKIIHILGPEKSSELILYPTSNQLEKQGLKYNCINLAIKLFRPEKINHIKLLFSTLGNKCNDVLNYSTSQEHIYVALCAINDTSCTELILDYFDDINLLARACTIAIKSNTNIKLAAKNNFIKLLSNRFRNLLSNSARTIDNSYELIHFAINTFSVELLKDYLALRDAEQIKQHLLTSRTMQYMETKIQVNVLTYALLYLNKQYTETKKIIELLIAALQDKAIEAVQNPYTPNKDFLFALINNHDETIYTLVINTFTKVEDLLELIKLINSNYFLNDASKKLQEVILSRAFAISSLNNSAAEQNNAEVNNSANTQPKISEIAAASLSKTLNPQNVGASTTRDTIGNPSDNQENELNLSQEVKPY